MQQAVRRSNYFFPILSHMIWPQAFDRNLQFVKVLYVIKFQSVWYLSVKFQVDRPGNKEVTIYPIALP